MKTIKTYIGGIAVLALAGIGLVACEKTFDEKLTTNSDLNNKTTVQVFNAIVNSNRTHVFIDGKRVTGATITQGTIYPSITPGFAVEGGLRPFLVRDTNAVTTQVPLSFAENMQVSKHQTIFVFDTITSPKQKTVVDDIVVPDDTTARIRFAYFAYNPLTLPPALDVYSVKRGANIFTNVQLTDVTSFIPFASGLTDTLLIRPTGTTNNLQNFTISGTPPVTTWADIRMIFTPTIKRSYTVTFWGSYRTTNTASAFERQMSLSVHH